MTLNTKGLNVRKMQKLCVFRTMGPVTAEAVQRKIEIAWIKNLGTDRVRRVSLPIMALTTDGNNGRLFLHEWVIRSMW